MFFDPRSDDHGLPHSPVNSLVVPRPIAWITTLNDDGSANLAPFSHYNVCSADPPAVMFAPGADSQGAIKDTAMNVLREREFVVNTVTADLSEAMNISSAELPYGQPEASLVGLSLEAGTNVRTPRVKQCPINLECVLETTVQLEGQTIGMIVIGRIVGVQIDPSVLTDGLIDIEKLRPLARLGYFNYTAVDSAFSMPRPSPEAVQSKRDG